MAEINTSGYQDLRDYVQATWKYIELRDGAGTAVLRIGVGADARATWTHTANAQTLKLQAVIKGSDAGMTLPKTFASSALYKVASGGTAYTVETFSSFTLENVGDQITIEHQIEVPQVG